MQTVGTVSAQAERDRSLANPEIVRALRDAGGGDDLVAALAEGVRASGLKGIYSTTESAVIHAACATHIMSVIGLQSLICYTQKSRYLADRGRFRRRQADR